MFIKSKLHPTRRLQADVVANVLREAPHLVETLLDGLIWRSHKTQDDCFWARDLLLSYKYAAT